MNFLKKQAITAVVKTQAPRVCTRVGTGGAAALVGWAAGLGVDFTQFEPAIAGMITMVCGFGIDSLLKSKVFK